MYYQPTTNNQQPTTNNQQSTINNQQSTTNNQQPTANMCLSIPGKLVKITSQTDEVFRVGKVSFDGILKEVSLTLVPEAVVGDYVLVHVGAAISIIDEDEAKKTFELLKQLEELNELEEGEN